MYPGLAPQQAATLDPQAWPPATSAPGQSHLQLAYETQPALITSISCPEPQTTTTGSPWQGQPSHQGHHMHAAPSATQAPPHAAGPPHQAFAYTQHPRAAPRPPQHAPNAVLAAQGMQMPDPGEHPSWPRGYGVEATGLLSSGPPPARLSFQGPPLYSHASVAQPTAGILPQPPLAGQILQPGRPPHELIRGNPLAPEHAPSPTSMTQPPLAGGSDTTANASASEAKRPAGVAGGAGVGERWWAGEGQPRQEGRREGFMGKLGELKAGPSQEQRTQAERAKLELKAGLEAQVCLPLPPCPAEEADEITAATQDG